MKRRDREASTSITHLVKTIAREVCEEFYEEKMDFEINLKRAEDEIARKAWVTCRTGEFWEEAEDRRLLQEHGQAIADIANRHGRTRGAIYSRLAHLKRWPTG